MLRIVTLLLVLSPVLGQAQDRVRRNFYGMHNLKDGGAPIPEGMNWTRHLVGEGGYVFDWVRGDYGRWVVDAMDRGLIPCLRLQDCNGGCTPDAGFPEIVASTIRAHLEAYRPEYLNRIIYLQLWNEPGDSRDLVEPEAFADFLVAAHGGVQRADTNDVFRTMTPGQNGPDWWRRAIRHNPAVCQAFDVWATHPYPESYPPHYNHHDGVPFINQVKTIDSYLLDLDAVASECEAQGSPRRGFPVMVTETIYGDRLGISYEGYPKTTRGGICSTDGPCDYRLASEYSVAAFTEFWHDWPEIVAVHPFILNNWSWEPFAYVSKTSGSRTDGPIPDWCPPEDIAAGTPWPSGYNEGAKRCGLPTAPYPTYRAVLDLDKPPAASLEPYRGPVGSLRGLVRRVDTREPIRFATVFTDGRVYGGPTMSDGIYVANDVPVGTYRLSVEKVGYDARSTTVTVEEGRETRADFDLPYLGKVSKGIYFQNQGTCSNCNLFAPFLGQSFTAPDDVGFIKFAAAMPNVGNVTMKFSILEGGPTGAQIGPSTTAFLEWGGEMIGAEWDGDGVPVTPGETYFLKVERADGQGVYLFATDQNPYASGMAFTGATPHPGWDLFATIRGNTVSAVSDIGLLEGRVEDETSAAIVAAQVTAHPGGSVATTDGNGEYALSLPQGAYSVTASRAGFEKETATGVNVVAAQTSVLNFTLTRDVTLGGVAGTVRDENDAPMSGASVTLTPGSLQDTTDGGGSFAFDDVAAGSYTLAASKTGYESTERTVVVEAGKVLTLGLTLVAIPSPSNLLVNGDFSDGLDGWSVWTERGNLSPETSSGALHLSGVGHNGGLYQSVATTPGVEVTIEGAWSSGPTLANAQWAEVLVIDGSRAPVNGQDLNQDAPDVVLAYKRDTWASPGGWSGTMTGGPGSFVPTGTTATIVLKSGNLPGTNTGTFFDDVVVRSAGAPPPPPENLITNGDFTSGFNGWSIWTERGSIGPVLDQGRAHLVGAGHNGGLYQQFATGGTGATITIAAFSSSGPTVANAQWSEVLVINGTRSPVNGQDLSAASPDVVLVYKRDTWQSPGGWSTPLTGGSFLANGDVATIVLKSGNLSGIVSGTYYDDVVVRSSNGSVNRAPTASMSASPTSGDAPLAVAFDASASADPDGDSLSYAWDFGDGSSGSGLTASHVYGAGGSFTATLTVADGKGATDQTTQSITVSTPSTPPGVLDWDARLTTLGLQVTEADVPAGTWYWKLVSASFESDGEILPPPGGGNESGGTHAIYVRASNPDGSFIASQAAQVNWPSGSSTFATKGAVDGYWGDFPMAGGWCPFFPDGPRGPYRARIAGAGTASDAVAGMGMPCNRHVSYRFEWRWSQKDSGQSKLTIHAGFGGPLSMQFVDRAKPRVVKILDSFSAAPEIKSRSPQTEIVGRAYLASQPMDGDPVARAHGWWSTVQHLVLQYPDVDYWEGYNEPVIQTHELMAWYAAFEAERVHILAAHGRRAAIGNFSVGNPDIPLWPSFYPAIDAAKANGGILGLHEYGTPMQQHFDASSGEGWFAGRYRKVYRQFLIPAGKVIPLVVTEAGVDVVPPVGWKNHFTEEEYLDQLKWYDSILLDDDYVLGATIFALEIPGWWSFDIAPIVESLADYVAASRVP